MLYVEWPPPTPASALLEVLSHARLDPLGRWQLREDLRGDADATKQEGDTRAGSWVHKLAISADLQQLGASASSYTRISTPSFSCLT